MREAESGVTERGRTSGGGRDGLWKGGESGFAFRSHLWGLGCSGFPAGPAAPWAGFSMWGCQQGLPNSETPPPTAPTLPRVHSTPSLPCWTGEAALPAPSWAAPPPAFVPLGTGRGPPPLSPLCLAGSSWLFLAWFCKAPPVMGHTWPPASFCCVSTLPGSPLKASPHSGPWFPAL